MSGHNNLKRMIKVVGGYGDRWTSLYFAYSKIVSSPLTFFTEKVHNVSCKMKKLLAVLLLYGIFDLNRGVLVVTAGKPRKIVN